MSTQPQEPIYEEVCVKTERQVTGWRMLEEPEDFPPSLFEDIHNTIGDDPDGVLVKHIYDGPSIPPTHTTSHVSPPRPTEAPAVPLPPAGWLFLSVVVVFLGSQLLRRFA